MTRRTMEIGSIAGVRIRLHASVLLMVALFAFLRADLPIVLGLVAVILVHELGHAFVARRRGLAVREVVVHGFGGYCTHEPGRPIDVQAIAWGGVLAQAWLGFALALVRVGLDRLPVGMVPPDPMIPFWIGALSRMNLELALVNLVPIRPLDGAEAWKLVGTLWRGRTESVRPQAPRSARTSDAFEEPDERRLAEVDAIVADALSRARRNER